MRMYERFVISFTVLILVSLSVLLLARAAAEEAPVGSGVVIQKAYTGPAYNTEVSFVSNGRGNLPILINSSEGEKWVLVVSHGGETFSADVDANTWEQLEAGDQVEVLEIRGLFGIWGKTIRHRKNHDH